MSCICVTLDDYVTTERVYEPIMCYKKDYDWKSQVKIE